MYKAKIDFVFNGVAYEKGDSIKVDTKEQLITLNEKGYIEPLTLKQIQKFGKEKIEIKKED